MKSFFVTTNNSEVAVYRSKWSAFFIIGFGICACLGCGIGLMSLGHDALPFRLFGALFFLIGLAVVLLLPRIVSSVANKPGVLDWSATKDGMRISGGSLLLSTKGIEEGDFYPWSDISKVVLANKWHEIQTGQKNYTWNMVVVFLKPEKYKHGSVIERSRRRRATAPDGSVLVVANFPKGEAQSLKANLEKVSPGNITIIVTDKIQFDWRTRVVIVD